MEPPEFDQPEYRPPAYPAAPPVPPVTYVQQKTNGLAVASLVLGIVWIYWIGSILAVIFGWIAMNQIRGSNGAQSGRGLAIAGFVLGWVGVGILLLILVLGASVGVFSSSSSS